MRKAWGYLRQVLAGRTGEAMSLAHLMNPDPDIRDAMGPGQGLAVAPGDVTRDVSEGALELPADDWSEFEDLLTSVGAEPRAPDMTDLLALRDQTIAELTQSLGNLRPLGDRLAETERARLALVDELREAQALADTLAIERDALLERLVDLEARPDPDAEPTRAAERALLREQRAHRRTEERLERWRAKYAERHRTAAARWHELRKLKRELRELRERLDFDS